MGAIGRLVRTTAFKLSFVYLVVFSGLTLFLIAYISNNTASLLDRQLDATISTEISSLSEQYRRGGIRQLVSTVELRSRRPGASLYLVSDFSGRTIVGNVADLPLAVLGLPDGNLTQVTYQRLDGDLDRRYDAMVRVFALPGGFKLLVGRDMGELSQLRTVIYDASQYAIVVMVVMGFVSWFFVSRSVLKRVENMAETGHQIMVGDLTRRLHVTGSGDEFDDLAESLNEMLERIESLMTGLKEVSDNIAHDLKTPLNRLHGRLEAMLRQGGGDPAQREALEDCLEEADNLIQVFDALLKIARMEAGSSGDSFADLDAADILEEIGELYQPVVEDAGGSLEMSVARPLSIRGNRTLISQALSNLLDNAIKYGRSGEDENAPLSVVLAGRQEGAFVALSVADAGKGIAPQDRERAMLRFVRLDKSRTRNGSGLGLSMVAAMAKMHGGQLRLEDAAPGLRAVLSLPVAAQRQIGRGGENGHRSDHAADGVPAIAGPPDH